MLKEFTVIQIYKVFIFSSFLILTTTCTVKSETPTPSDPLVVSLADCIRIVLDSNIDLIEVRDNLALSREKIRQAGRRLWPSLSLTATDNSSLGDSGAFSQYDPSTGQRFVPGEGFQTSASLQWSLHDSGSRRSNLKSEEANLAVNDLTYQQTRRDVIRQVIAQYLEILELNAEKDVRTEQLNQASESLKIAQGRLDTGSGIAYEVLLEEAYLSQAEADLQSTGFALNHAIRTLLIAMRMNVTRTLELIPVDPPEITESTDPETLQKLALENRLEFPSYRSRISSLQMQLKIIEALRKPKLDFFMTFNQQGQSIRAYDEGDISWSAGLSLSFSPFPDSTLTGSSQRNWINSSEFMQKSVVGFYLNDGSSSIDSEMEMRIRISKLERELMYLQETVTAEVFEASENYQSSRSIYNARQSNLSAMEENERIQQKRFELGLNQYKDVVDARTDLVSARIAHTRAMYTMEHYRIELKYVLGILDDGE